MIKFAGLSVQEIVQTYSDTLIRIAV
ncbi:RNA polymerase sigma factor, partial [Clostridioides difficile]|nr:RNA polymerase sigma factor [Clostridioides difficile]